MPAPILPTQRVPSLPIAQLLHQIPNLPDPADNAYLKKSKSGKKGGLPIEIVAAAQDVYTKTSPQPGNGGPAPLQGGWGGAGR